MANSKAWAVGLVDIPRVIRLSENGTILNSELGLTRDVRGPNSSLLSSIIFSRDVHTLVARAGDQQVVGQFRYREDESYAHIVYMAPGLTHGTEDTAWLHLLDAMAREAGKHGAHTLIAEVDEMSVLFETLRVSGFAVYVRQTIWRHAPFNEGDIEVNPDLILTEETERDHIGIMSLMVNTIPAMVQQVTTPNGDMQGWVYRKADRIEGYIAISEGKEGVYLIPYLHPDILDEATAVMAAAINQTQRNRKVPVYVCVRAYQDWLGTAMENLAFEPEIGQAVMVRHITAGIRHPSFARAELQTKWDGIHSPVPPASRIVSYQDKQD